MQGRKTNTNAVDSMSGISPKKFVLKQQPAAEKMVSKLKPNKSPAELFAFEVRFPKIRALKLPYRSIGIITAAGVGLVIVTAGSIYGVKSFTKSSPVEVQEIGPSQTVPSFETLAPNVNSKVEKTATYDDEKKVASYNDKIAGTDVTVSQQPLPDSFKASPMDEVEKLAKNFKATKRINTGKVIAFTGISSEDGTQTVIFAKKDLLIFIRATKELNSNNLAAYIDNLK